MFVYVLANYINHATPGLPQYWDYGHRCRVYVINTWQSFCHDLGDIHPSTLLPLPTLLYKYTVTKRLNNSLARGLLKFYTLFCASMLLPFFTVSSFLYTYIFLCLAFTRLVHLSIYHLILFSKVFCVCVRVRICVWKRSEVEFTLHTTVQTQLPA